MEIEIRGKNEKLSRKEMLYVLQLFAHWVLGPRLSKNVYVEVVNEKMGRNYCGFCAPTDYGYRNHRFFEITINNTMSRPMQLRTLAHEMVHVMQFARNQFKMLDEENMYKWRGKLMRINREKYFSMPWEKEAHNSEDYLLEMYREHCKEYDIRFKKSN